MCWDKKEVLCFLGHMYAEHIESDYFSTQSFNLRQLLDLVLRCFLSASEDKGALGKLVEAIKTNYNDRYEEVRNHNYGCFYCSLESTMANPKACAHTPDSKIMILNVSFRSVVTGEVDSSEPNPQLASTSWRSQRPRSWRPSLVKLFWFKINVRVDNCGFGFI